MLTNDKGKDKTISEPETRETTINTIISNKEKIPLFPIIKEGGETTKSSSLTQKIPNLKCGHQHKIKLTTIKTVH